MIITHTRHPACARRNTRIMALFSTALLVFCAGMVNAPAVIAAPVQVPVSSAATAAPASASTVAIDQQPLTIRPKIPPNIMLMLDDSGSMAWDYMPDWDYIGNGVCEGQSEKNYSNINAACLNALRDSKINGTYYNPGVIYTPPPKADGSSYAPSPGLDSAYKNGFTSSSTTDVTQYDHDYPYYTKETGTTIVPYGPAPGCADGSKPINNGSECITNATYHYMDDEESNNWWGGGNNGPYCKYHKYELIPTGQGYDSYDRNDDGFICRKATNYDTVPVSDNYPYCDKGGTFNATTGKCERDEDQDFYLFTYTTDDGNGNYVQHYIGKSQDACNAAPAGSDCDYSAATQQNVANWFSYYRTRMLLAKTGLMRAFATFPTNYRFGFGTINNSNSNDVNFAGATTVTPDAGDPLAEVQQFGNGSSTSDQKSRFWSWVADIEPSGGTPLRLGLQSVGQYYQTSQPWETMQGEPTYGQAGATALQCRQSYVILTTDGFWNGATPSGIGDADNTDGPKITNPNGGFYTYSPAMPFSGPYYKSGVSDSYGSPVTKNTLADVAMYYWDHDLRPALGNEVPKNNSDPAFWQHMVTFAIGMGFTPQDIEPDGTSVNDIFTWANGGSKDKIDGFKWPEPSAPDSSWDQGQGGTIDNISDMVHAAVNGHGGFFSATNPQSFVSGLRGAVQRASERTGSGASLAADSTELKTGTVAYQALYHTVEWTGELKALPVNADTGAVEQKSIKWNAAQELTSADASSRTIWTWNTDTKAAVVFANGTASAPASGSSLASPASSVPASASSAGATSATGTTPPALSTAQLAALGTTSAVQVAVVSYLRGNASNEQKDGGNFRNRSTALGDIVDSQPVFVGQVDANEFVGSTFKGSTKFGAFAAKENTGSDARGADIFVAANDGMLHAFDANTGVENFAYLPGAVITSGIADLADPNYGTDSDPHQYFNDGELTVADAYINSAWHTVLVGTTGRGKAKAVYALDVTNPDKPTVMWERSAGDGETNSGYIGQMTGKPVIAQVADGDWVVLMGNGYNSANGKATLLQFNLSDGALEVYKTNDDTGNGLAAPGVWIGDPSNGLATTAYAGDLEGNVWSFTLSKDAGTTGTKLFTTSDGSKPQPITAGMLIGKNPQTGDLWVFFGTGRYLASGDIADTQVQSWYGLVVKAGGGSAMKAVTSSDTLADLAQRKIVAQTAGSTDADTGTVTLPTRVITTRADINADPNDDIVPISGKAGWYIKLLTPVMNADGTSSGGYGSGGERMVTPDEFQGLLIGTTLVPKASDVCNPSGTGWIMGIDPFTGTNPVDNFFDVNGDGQVNGSDSTDVGGSPQSSAGVGFNSLPNNPIFVGPSMLVNLHNGQTPDVHRKLPQGSAQRVSWGEVIN